MIEKRINTVTTVYTASITVVYVIMIASSFRVASDDIGLKLVITLIWLVSIMIIQAVGSVGALLATALTGAQDAGDDEAQAPVQVSEQPGVTT